MTSKIMVSQAFFLLSIVPTTLSLSNGHLRSVHITNPVTDLSIHI